MAVVRGRGEGGGDLLLYETCGLFKDFCALFFNKPRQLITLNTITVVIRQTEKLICIVSEPCVHVVF